MLQRTKGLLPKKTQLILKKWGLKKRTFYFTEIKLLKNNCE